MLGLKFEAITFKSLEKISRLYNIRIVAFISVQLKTGSSGALVHTRTELYRSSAFPAKVKAPARSRDLKSYR